MGRTNVRHQVEVCIALVNQHGVHGTIDNFGSNINLQNNEERYKPINYEPTILLDQYENDGNHSCFLDLGNLQRWCKIWNSVTHLHL
jgi:hypothetical protein